LRPGRFCGTQLGKPTFSSPFTPVKGSACAERNLSVLSLKAGLNNFNRNLLFRFKNGTDPDPSVLFAFAAAD
jgi:hypothetical protein